MTWARLDDQYPHHPKSLKAGLDALGFDAAGICYCSRHLTDGFIADASLRAVYPPVSNPERLAKKLVSVGRWKRDNRRKGYVIKDYLDYNPSREQVLRDRKAARVRANKRRSSGEQTPNKEGGSSSPTRTRPDPKGKSKATTSTKPTQEDSTEPGGGDELSNFLKAEGYDPVDIVGLWPTFAFRQSFGEHIADPLAWFRARLTRLASTRSRESETKVALIDGERMEFRDGQWEVVA